METTHDKDTCNKPHYGFPSGDRHHLTLADIYCHSCRSQALWTIVLFVLITDVFFIGIIVALLWTGVCG